MKWERLIYPTAYTMKVIPSKVDYKYGKNYLLSILSVVYINISDSSNNLAREMNIAAEMSEHSGEHHLVVHTYKKLMQISDGFSVIFFFIIGILLEVLNKKIENRKNLISIVLIAYFLNPFLWIVRNVYDNFTKRTSMGIYYQTYILYKLIYEWEKRKKKEVNILKNDVLGCQ